MSRKVYGRERLQRVWCNLKLGYLWIAVQYLVRGDIR